MNYALRYNKRFLRDVEAVHYYDEERAGLGDRFLLAVQAHTDKLTRHPHAFAKAKDPKCRRIVVRKFPYSLYYRITGRTVTLARCHNHWQKPLF